MEHYHFVMHLIYMLEGSIMLKKLCIYFFLISSSVQAVVGEENVALWQLVGLETKALVEIATLLNISTQQLKMLEEKYDDADEYVNKAQYAYYLAKRISNIKEEMVHVKNIQTLRDNVATGVALKNESVNFAENEIRLVNALIKKDEFDQINRELRLKELMRLLKEASSGKNSLIGSQGTTNRINGFNAETNANSFEQDKNYYAYQYSKDVTENNKKLFQEYEFLKFNGLLPINTPFSAYAAFIEKQEKK